MTSAPSRRTRSAFGRAHAGEGLDQLGLAVALHACDGDDLAASDVERNLVDCSMTPLVADHQIVDFEYQIAGLCRRLVDDQLHLPADHHRGQLLLGRLGRRGLADYPAPAQDRDAVGEGTDLSQLVADEDHGVAARP